MRTARDSGAATPRRGASTIDDFSVQWRSFTDQRGYYASEELLADVLAPFVRLPDLAGATVAEIGCGNGRFVRLLARHAARVIGVEPGDGAENARAYCADCPNVEIVRADVYALPPLPPLDYVFAIGVVHHLPDPAGALRRMRELVRPGGRVLVWVYGREGNALYLAVFGRLRRVTSRLPHRALRVVAAILAVGLRGYVAACRALPLPMRTYARNVLAPLDHEALCLNVYDQLNPTIAFYWRRDEVERLLRDAGLVEVALHHRHGYSWTATGIRPA